MVRVLFVCMGNICRSPLAQGVLENVLRREGLQGEVFVDSAGTGHWHAGSPPDERAQRSASSRGLDLSSQRRSEEHTSELQSRQYLVCRLLLEKKKKTTTLCT